MKGVTGELSNFFRTLYHRLPGYRYVNFCRSQLAESLIILKLRILQLRKVDFNEHSDLIVALTSFPERINDVWISIESIFQQTYKPVRVFLVLSDEEFPDRRLPDEIISQVRRGLELFWVKENSRSYKKILPVYEELSDNYRMVIVDDDLVYDFKMLEKLVECANKYPAEIIGFRGWEIGVKDNKILPYSDWDPADSLTPNNKVFLTSGAGTLIPKNAFRDEIFLNYTLANKLCPTADDIWLWANSKISGVRQRCLGYHRLTPVRRQYKSPALQDENIHSGKNDAQFKSIVEHFDLYKHVGVHETS